MKRWAVAVTIVHTGSGESTGISNYSAVVVAGKGDDAGEMAIEQLCASGEFDPEGCEFYVSQTEIPDINPRKMKIPVPQ